MSDLNKTRGTYSGVLNNTAGESICYKDNDGWIRIVTEYKPRNQNNNAAIGADKINEVKVETVFLRRIME